MLTTKSILAKVTSSNPTMKLNKTKYAKKTNFSRKKKQPIKPIKKASQDKNSSL
jgi:hypothetical protein